jgi:hypothetical protein
MESIGLIHSIELVSAWDSEVIFGPVSEPAEGSSAFCVHALSADRAKAVSKNNIILRVKTLLFFIVTSVFYQIFQIHKARHQKNKPLTGKAYNTEV